MSKPKCNNDDIGSDCQWWNDGNCEHTVSLCGIPQPVSPGKHTPGPWKVAGPKEGGCLDQKENRLICTTIKKHLYHIAETFQYRNTEFNTSDGVSLANARLIAAAPDLLTACKALMDSHGMHGPCEQLSCSSCTAARKAGQAAIAKATQLQKHDCGSLRDLMLRQNRATIHLIVYPAPSRHVF